MKVAGFYPESISNGYGWRAVLFVSGCPRRCPGCHNPDALDPDYGVEFDPEVYLDQIRNNSLLQGVTISGGDPFLYPNALIPFIRQVKALGLDVWVYTGYRLEEIENDLDKRAMLEEIDVLVDGPFIQALAKPELRFKGSVNQRIIDVKERNIEKGTNKIIYKSY